MQYNSGDEVIFAEQYPMDINFMDEHERIQKKVFTNWINYYVPNCIEKDIITELRDGTKLILLIEALTGEKLQCEKGKKLRRVHFISNINKVLNYLEKRKLKLVNINSTDIVDGNTCIILGLIWSLILRFHITEYFHISNQDVSRSNDQLSKYSPQLPLKTAKDNKNSNEINNARKMLIDKFNRKFDLNIKNFKGDWRDGLNLLKIIDKLKPSLQAVKKGLELKSNLERIDLALNLANDHLNVKKLLDAEDIEDEKSLITYLTQFLQKYPQLESDIKLDLNQNLQPISPIKFNQQSSQPQSIKPEISSSKLFEEQILDHECTLVKEFIDKVYITGINLQNLNIYNNQFNNLEPLYNKNQLRLSSDYQQKWKTIKDELNIANQIYKLIKDGEQQMQNYTIPCSYEQCRQQLIKHCNYFNKELNLNKKPILIRDLVDNYNRCLDDVKKWQEALEKASKMWKIYESSKTKLMNWLTEADALLLKSHEPKLDKDIRRENLENLKQFFSKKDENEKILKEFIVACEDILLTLPDENKPELRSTLTSMVNRFYKIINYSAPQHLIKFEFDFIECDFFDKVRSLKNSKSKDEQLNHEALIESDLKNLENLSSIYWNSFNDKLLLDKAINHRREWEKYKKRIDDNYNLIKKTTIDLIKEAEYGVNLVKNNDLKADILIHNENLFNKIHNKLNDLKNLEHDNQLGLENDLKEIENQINRLLEDLNLVIEDKILNWCKVKDRSRLPSPDLSNENNSQKILIQKIDFYSKLVNEFEKYENLISKSKQLIDSMEKKLDELNELTKRPKAITTIDDIALNYRACSNTIETTINKILDEVKDINNRLRDHNYLEELHANEILNELKRLKQRNEEQYSYLIDSFSKDLLKQIDIYRVKCEHCDQIKSLRDLLLEVRNLNTTSVHKLEHLNINDVRLHNKLLGSLEDLIKLIDEKCNTLMNVTIPKEEDKRIRITTELTQKKIVEEIDGKGERSSSQISEYNFKDLSNVNPFYQTTTTTNTTTNTYTNKLEKGSDGGGNYTRTVIDNLKPIQNDFSQQFNLSQENLKDDILQSNKKVIETKQETLIKESKILESKNEKIEQENLPSDDRKSTEQEKPKERRRESYEIEAEKERERLEEEFKREQERIENELKKEKERLEEEARKQREKLEEDARKERERIEEEMLKEKERLEAERIVEKDNNLIKSLNDLIDKLIDMINSNKPEETTTDDLRNCLASLKQLCIQAKYIKDTQLNDKDKIKNFEIVLNETACKLLSLVESKIANDLGKENFDLSKLNEIEIINLNDNVNRVEYGFKLITNFVHCMKEFNQTISWIDENKEKINLLPFETIENLIDQFKKFTNDYDNHYEKLEDTKDKLNSELKLTDLIKTPYSDDLNQLRLEYTDKCKEIFDDLSNELKNKASDIEEKAKECETFNDFNKVNQELIKLRKNNEVVLDKVKNEPNLEIISELSKIDNQLEELSKKLENILDDKAAELIQFGEFKLEPNDLKIEFNNLEDKSEHFAKLQNEIENYKNLLINNDIFLDNLRKKLNDIDLKPVEEAIKSCQNYADNITDQIDKLQSSLKDLNNHLIQLGCIQELSGTDALNELNKLKVDYENKLDELIGDLVKIVRNNFNDLKEQESDDLKDIEAQIINLDKLSNKFDVKANQLNLNDNLQVKQMQNDLDNYKIELNDKYDNLKELQRIKEEEERLKREEEERLRKLEEERLEKERLKREEEERLKKEEEERLRKLEEERLEKERLKKLEEERLEKERLKKLEEERLEKERLKREEEERLKKEEEERLKKEEEERLKREEEERLKKEEEEERLRKLEEERLEKERLKREEERLKKEEEERLKREEEARLKKEEEERAKIEEERLEKERLKKLEIEKRIKKENEEKRIREEAEREEERLRKLEEEENLKRKEDENDFVSAANLSKIDNQNENDDKKLKKLTNNKHQIKEIELEEEPAIIQVKMPSKKSKALLTNTSRMYSIEHYSELEDSVDGEPIIELADSDNESNEVNNFILQEILEALNEMKNNQNDLTNLANLTNELKNLKNICFKVNNVRNSSSDNNLDEHLKMITDQLNGIFTTLKDILNQQIPNLPDQSDKGEAKEQNLIDNINLYTEIVTEFDKFDDLVNNNKEFIDEIYRQLNRIDNRSLDNKLVDYRQLLDKINSQIDNVNNEITNINGNLNDLKYKDGLKDDKLTTDELEKLQKLCQFQMDNSIEDLYINYIKKLNNLEAYLNETADLDDLETIMESICDLKEEIKDKIDNLELNNSPLLKNLLDQVEKLKNKIETKIENLILEQTSEIVTDEINEELLKEKQQRLSRKPLKLQTAEDFMEFSIEKTPDTDQVKSSIFKQNNELKEAESVKFQSDILQYEPPYLETKNIKIAKSEENQMTKEADKQLDEILNKLKKLRDSFANSQDLSFEETKDKMDNLIELVSCIQLINEQQQPSETKLQEVTKELNQVIDCLSKSTNDYIRKVCERENTKPLNIFNDLSGKLPINLSTKSTQTELDELINDLKPKFECVTEYRKFEKLSENNEEKISKLNEIINQLSRLPIDKKIKNLKDCISNAERFTNDLTNDVNEINETLRNLKLITDLKPNVTIERYTEIKTICRSDYGDLVKKLCKEAKGELNKFNKQFNDSKTTSKLKELKKSVLSSTSNYEVEFTTADLMNDLMVREVMNEFKILNKKIDDKISKLIKEEKSPFNAKIKKETKSHLLKSNSADLVGGSSRNLNTGNELIKFLKEMIIKLDKLIKQSNSNDNELISYLNTLKEVCNQSLYVRDNEPQLSEELNLIDENLEILRINLMNLITQNVFNNLLDQRFELRNLEFKLKNIDFNQIKLTNDKQLLDELELNTNLINEFNKLDKLMNEIYEFIKNFESKLDYLPLRTLEELLDNYKITIFEIEILKAKLLDNIEMVNSRLEDCNLDCELITNPIIDELNILKERYELKCKELFDNFAREGQKKISEYIRKCTNCNDRSEFQFMLNDVKEFNILNTNRINKIIQSTQTSLDKLLGKLNEEDANNNNLRALDDQQQSSAIETNLNTTLSDSSNMIYICEFCIDVKCNCVPKLEETEIPTNIRKRNNRTKRGSRGSSVRNSLNMTQDQLNDLDEQDNNNNNSNKNDNNDTTKNSIANELDGEKLNELQFELWLEAMSNTIDFLLDEKQNINQNDFQELAIHLKKMQNLKHSLKMNFNHPANSNKAILNQYRIIYLTLEREICLLKRQVEKLRTNQPINLPINKEGRVVCQNMCSRRNFFKTLFKVTIPLQVILLTMFGISSLLPSSNDDFRCTVTNSLRNTLGPRYGYDGTPPV